jgi:hypothetical protein
VCLENLSCQLRRQESTDRALHVHTARLTHRNLHTADHITRTSKVGYKQNTDDESHIFTAGTEYPCFCSTLVRVKPDACIVQHPEAFDRDMEGSGHIIGVHSCVRSEPMYHSEKVFSPFRCRRVPSEPQLVAKAHKEAAVVAEWYATSSGAALWVSKKSSHSKVRTCTNARSDGDC